MNRKELEELIEEYEKNSESITKGAMTLAVLSNMDYHAIMRMTVKEQKILGDVLRERDEAMNPNKKVNYL